MGGIFARAGIYVLLAFLELLVTLANCIVYSGDGMRILDMLDVTLRVLIKYAEGGINGN